MAKKSPKQKILKVQDFFKKEEIGPMTMPLTGKYLIHNPTFLPEYNKRKFLVWGPVGGFGTEEGKIGRGIFGCCVGDGEGPVKFYSSDFGGVFLGDVEALKNEV